LNLEYHELLSKFTVNFNLRRYIMVGGNCRTAEACDAAYALTQPTSGAGTLVGRCRLNR